MNLLPEFEARRYNPLQTSFDYNYNFVRSVVLVLRSIPSFSCNFWTAPTDPPRGTSTRWHQQNDERLSPFTWIRCLRMVSIPSAWAAFKFLKDTFDFNEKLKQKVGHLTSVCHPKKPPPSVGYHSSYRLRYRTVVPVFSFRIYWSRRSRQRGKADEVELRPLFPSPGIRTRREVCVKGPKDPRGSCWEMRNCWSEQGLSIVWRLVEGLWTWVRRGRTANTSDIVDRG